MGPHERLRDICALCASEALDSLATLALRHSPVAFECVRAALEGHFAIPLCLRFLSCASRAQLAAAGGGAARLAHPCLALPLPHQKHHPAPGLMRAFWGGCTAGMAPLLPVGEWEKQEEEEEEEEEE